MSAQNNLPPVWNPDNQSHQELAPAEWVLISRPCSPVPEGGMQHSIMTLATVGSEGEDLRSSGLWEVSHLPNLIEKIVEDEADGASMTIDPIYYQDSPWCAVAVTEGILGRSGREEWAELDASALFPLPPQLAGRGDNITEDSYLSGEDVKPVDQVDGEDNATNGTKAGSGYTTRWRIWVFGRMDN